MIDYKTAAIAGSINEGQISLSKTTLEQYSGRQLFDLWQFLVVSLDQYNRVMGTKETLKEDEAMICTIKADYKEDTIAVEGGKNLQDQKRSGAVCTACQRYDVDLCVDVFDRAGF